ncbi:MAG: GNAT family N-acetyltransferase [Deltaproteobacteria bacterium]|jgi:RimJ/RimL family protein N-acetyltransferase|nr:GNAT family N-acetyltransferase [Deltaproteobacteria bacterium]
MNHKTLLLETNRLIMRSFQDKDIQAFADYRSEIEVAKYQSWNTPYSLEKAIRFINEMKAVQPGTPGKWYQVAIELKKNGSLVGDCAFQIFAEEPRQAEIGVTLSGKYQGKGYATEAVTRLLNYLFTGFKLHRIRAICDVENIASSKLLESIGMRWEGHLVENIWFKGKWGSEYMYGLLKQEWNAHQK